MDRRLAPLGIGLICVALTVGTVTSSVAAPPDTTSTVTVTTGAIPSRVDELFSGSLNAAERIHDEYASAAAKADSPPDTRAFWGYDRDAFERRASDLLDELAERFPDSFAGGALDPAKALVTVGVTRDDPELAKFASDQADAFEVEYTRMPYSLSERTALVQDFREAEIGSVNDGLMSDLVEVQVPVKSARSDAARIASTVASATLSLARAEGAAVELEQALVDAAASADRSERISIGPVAITVADVQVETESISAGVALKNSAGSNVCTSGFAMRKKSTGVLYITTAAHCYGVNLYRSGTLLPWTSAIGTSIEDYANGQDWGYLSVPSPVAPPVGVVWVDANTQYNVQGAWRSSWPGLSRCHMGGTTGYSCSTLMGDICGGFESTLYDSDGGDSGGPVIYPYGTILAAGLHTGTCLDSSSGRWFKVYTKIYNVEKAGNSSATYEVVTN